MLNLVMLNVVMLNVVLLNVVEPNKKLGRSVSKFDAARSKFVITQENY